MTGHQDAETRRTQLADAALSLAAAGGLGRVTVAAVAKRAGVSVGLVQHHFPAKQQLMIAAHQRSLEVAFSRVAEVVEQGELRGVPIRGMVVDALSELLPLDSQRRDECSVRAQFAGLAVADPELAAVAREAAARAQARLAQVVDNGRECGETGAQVTSGSAAWSLWSLVQGLSMDLLHGADVPAVEVLSEASAQVFPNPCRRRGTSLVR